MTENPYDEFDDGKGYGSNADTIRKYAWNEGYNQGLKDLSRAVEDCSVDVTIDLDELAEALRKKVQ